MGLSSDVKQENLGTKMLAYTSRPVTVKAFQAQSDMGVTDSQFGTFYLNRGDWLVCTDKDMWIENDEDFHKKYYRVGVG